MFLLRQCAIFHGELKYSQFAVFHILTHAESSVFKSFRVHIYDPFSKTRKSLELKTVQEQLAGIPCKMSKDEQKRISNKKVTLILSLTLFWQSTVGGGVENFNNPDSSYDQIDPINLSIG